MVSKVVNLVMPDTVIYRISNDITKEEYEYIKKAGSVIRSGGLVAFPTETVYGLGGNALDPKASCRIYSAKGRPSDNPLIAHISDISQLSMLAAEVPDEAVKLTNRFWPGPLTIILKKKKEVPYETTGGLDTVAIRMPDNPVALAFIREAGVPIAAPSANVSGKPSPTTAEHVKCDLDGRIDIILDGGPVDIGLESTIVDMTGKVPVILRPGYIDTNMLSEVFEKVDRDPAISGNVGKDVKPKAPGMKYRHYAPEGELTIISWDADKVSKRINELAVKYDEAETGIITTTENRDSYKYGKVICIGSRNDELSIAQGLYGALREMDEYKIKHIYIEGFSDENLGDAIMNRLMKAAGHKIIYV